MARHAGRAFRLAALLLPVAALLPAVALAQGTARSLDLDPGIRAAGMGGTSAAVFWGGDLDPWGNPALLPFGRGLRYAWGSTGLVPDVVPDVEFRTHRVSYADFGLGVDIGRYTLDYGSSEGVDQSGNPTGTFDAREHVHVFGAGASLSGLVEGASLLFGRDAPAWTSYVDVAGGINRKSVDILLDPTIGSRESAHPLDWGVMARVSPLPAAIGRPVGFDLAYGHAVLNANDVIVSFPPTFESAPTSRIFRDGGAARLWLAASPDVLRSLGWLGSPTRPAFSIAVGYDTEHVQAGSDPNGYDVKRWGFEGDLLGLLTLRMGHVEDRGIDIRGTSYGLGVGLPVRQIGGARFDFASTPQPEGLKRLSRYGVSAWLDPLALAREVQGR